METQQNLEVRPSGAPKLSLGFLFLSIGVLVTLITSVVSFLNLVFSALDKKFPDVLNATYQYGYSSYDYESIRMSLATLVIFFPIFLVVSYFWNKNKARVLSMIDEVIRKWMVYIILFLSSLVIAIDLVTLVKYFVSGEITNRFIFKVVVVLLVALFVGIYHIFELKGRQKYLGLRVGMWSAIKSSVWVALAIYFAFCVMGSPMKQRDLRLDERRIQDLSSIQSQVIYFWQQKEKLPAKIEDLANPISYYSLPVDPEFEKGRKYEYNIKDEAKLTFELCAEFSEPIPKGWREYGYYGKGGGILPMMAERDMAVSYPYPGPGGTNESWDHQEGRICFERTIDPDLYPPFQQPLRD
jgi:hypothetical protein